MATNQEKEDAYAAMLGVGFAVDESIEGMQYALQFFNCQLPVQTKLVAMAVIAHHLEKILLQMGDLDLVKALEKLAKATD